MSADSQYELEPQPTRNGWRVACPKCLVCLTAKTHRGVADKLVEHMNERHTRRGNQ